MNSTITVRVLLTLSLVANIALGWMLWQQRQHPEQTKPTGEYTISVSPTKAQTTPAQPLPASVVDSAIQRAPRIEPPLPPPTRGGMATTKSEALLFSNPEVKPVDPSKLPAYLRLETPERKAYGPPPPPNPHAVPPWELRLPHREDQMQRGLYSTPLKLDK
ncbi:hypothetical protein DES53_102923 [Roseimicrobium gellanilyticum]|uniref:Uncharacterized protein n=1 Tax=Roseimicrobium gellanilyticum TaxID=748857 RepID=A0A366HS80_9BACT|nr:hypothetical protein [Roseimicrobium gellanilyticum]RBP46532.1 hypothetical protein DES53_102923 [Roseimicrobium gellanilyticum]